MSVVSIIVPVYNVSQWLDRCLCSLVNQTLKDIEIILVNDASLDPKDDEICQKYASQDSRITYIVHKKNLGLGGARNTGIQHAKSEYLGFVDSDDWIAFDMYELLFNIAKKTNSDIVACNFSYTSSTDPVVYDSNEMHGFDMERIDDSRLRTVKIIPENLFSLNETPAVWNKLWKKSLYVDNDVHFPNYLYYEDLCTSIQVFYYATQVTFVEETLYYYFQRTDSIINSTSKKHFDDYLVALSSLEKFLRDKNIFSITEKAFFNKIKVVLHLYVFDLEKANIGSEDKKNYIEYAIKNFFQSQFMNMYLHTQDFDTLKYILAPEHLTAEHINKIAQYTSKITQQKNEIDNIKNNIWYQFGLMSKKRKLVALATIILNKFRYRHKKI